MLFGDQQMSSFSSTRDPITPKQGGYCDKRDRGWRGAGAVAVSWSTKDTITALLGWQIGFSSHHAPILSKEQDFSESLARPAISSRELQ